MTTNENHFCTYLLPTSLDAEERQASSTRKAALLPGAKWDVGSAVTIRFLEGPAELHGRVRKVAEEWTGLANLTFDFRSAGPTDIRIAFQPGNGSWSYLGTTCRQIPEPKPTMNYGWLTPASTDDALRRVVLHEFGHAIGMIHEHQNPKDGGIRWNRDAVIRDLSGPPNNWSPETIEHNIFRRYDANAVAATGVDPLSIMMYPIPRAWTDGSFSAGLNSELSERDKQFIAEHYPK